MKRVLLRFGGVLVAGSLSLAFLPADSLASIRDSVSDGISQLARGFEGAKKHLPLQGKRDSKIRNVRDNQSVSMTDTDGRLGLPGQSVELYGSVIESNDGLTPGIYKVPTSSSGSFQLVAAGMKAKYAVSVNGQYIGHDPGDGYYSGPSYASYDLSTGQKTGEWSGDDYQYMCFGMDVDPVTGEIYGAFYDEDGYTVELATVTFDGAKPTRTRTIGKLTEDFIWHGFAIDAEGQMYGIAANAWAYDSSAVLYKIDRETAAMTKVGSTGFEPGYAYNLDACFDRKTGTLYWIYVDDYDDSYLTTINLLTGKATKILTFSGSEYVGGIEIPAVTANAAAPRACENIAVNFTEGNLGGNVTLRTPSLLNDGSVGSGALTVKIMAADNLLASKQCEWGVPETIPVTLTEAGMYNFTIFAENEAGEGVMTDVNGIFVGPDKPETPVVALAYEDGTMKVSWQPVTESVNGGWMDLSGLTYTVTRFPGAETVASGLKATEFSEPVEEPETSTECYYEVTAGYADVKSDAGKSNSIYLGTLAPPYTSDFSAGLDGYTIIDVNNDRKTWSLYEGEMRVCYNSEMDMDDWLITPAFKLEAGKSYKLRFKAHAHTSSCPEAIEVKYGFEPTVEAMQNVLLEPTTFTATSNKEFTAVINADRNGKYYIGFHGISEADQYYLYLSEYTIEAGVAASVPAAVNDLVVTPASGGELSARISFTAPTVDIYGDPIESLDKIEVYRATVEGTPELVKTYKDQSAGKEISFTDNVPSLGDYIWSVYSYGIGGKSEAATAGAYVGVKIPADMGNVYIRRTANVGEVTLTWEPVTTDIDGGALDASQVGYIVAVPGEDGFIPVSGILTSLTYTFDAVSPTEQAFVQVAVFPVTEAGTGMGRYAPTIPAGKPYGEFHESFALGGMDYEWITDSSLGGRWMLATTEKVGIEAPDGDGGMVAMQGSNLNHSADLMSGIIDLAQIPDAALTFQVYNLSTSDNGANANEVLVSVATNSSNGFVPVLHKTVQELANPKSWGAVKVDLSDFDGEIVQLMFTVIVKQYTTTLLDDIRVESQEVTLPAPRNLSATIQTGHIVLAWEKPEFAEDAVVREEHLLGYHVYRDGEKSIEDYIPESTHKDEDVTSGNTYVYHVTALYERGESEPSNQVSLQFVVSGVDAVAADTAVYSRDGEIVISGAEGSRVTVVSASGVKIFDGVAADVTVIRAEAGAYVVTVGNKAYKLLN